MLFSTPEIEERRAARPGWLKSLILVGWVAWGAMFVVGGAGSFFLLCWIAAETLAGR